MVELLQSNLTEIDAHLRELGWTASEIAWLKPIDEGNMNRTLRAQLTDGDSIVLKQAVDHVAKYPDIPAPIERAGVEAAFYATIKSDHDLARHMPRLVGYDAANQLLGMQDLGESRDFVDVYSLEGTVSSNRERLADALSCLLAWLSRLHALPPPTDFPKNRAMRVLNHAHIFEIPLQRATHQQLGVKFGPRMQAVAQEITQNAALHAQAQQLGRIYLGSAAFDSRPVILHGDFYPGSWLRDSHLGARIIDPEFAFEGPAEFDVGVFMAHLTFAGFDQADVVGVLKDYVTPPAFDHGLAWRFAGMELIRRLLGVAQLPLTEDDATKVAWLTVARGFLAS